jgi:hypothetical protein
LAIGLRLEVDVICPACQNADEHQLAAEGGGVTKQLALDLRLKEVPGRFHWERRSAKSLRNRALEATSSLPRENDEGTMDAKREPWETYFAVHKNCKHCRHFGTE